jgi:hypothetical protein
VITSFPCATCLENFSTKTKCYALIYIIFTHAVLTQRWGLGILSRNFVRLVLRLPGAISALWMLGHQLSLVRSSLGKEKSRIASS